MEATFGPNLERRKEISEGLRRTEGGGFHVMGVLNITPDSFHAASRLASTEQAIQTGLKMWEDGAKWLDIGGESTRPGAEPVLPKEEIERVVPVGRVVERSIDSRTNYPLGISPVDRRDWYN